MDSMSHRERWVVLWHGPLRVDYEDTIRESNAILMIPVLSRVQKLILRVAPSTYIQSCISITPDPHRAGRATSLYLSALQRDSRSHLLFLAGTTSPKLGTHLSSTPLWHPRMEYAMCLRRL